MGANVLQDPWVMVVFGLSKSEVTHRAIQVKRGILGSQKAGELRRKKKKNE